MPLDPLYIPTRQAVLDSMRLTDAVNTPAMTAVDNAIKSARVRFYKALGAARATAISGYAHADAPTSENDIVRANAEGLELKMIRMELLRTMPTAMLDSGAGRDRWNTEGILNDPGIANDAEINRLESEIATGLADLEGDDEEDDSGLGVATIGPECPTFIYDSIRNTG